MEDESEPGGRAAILKVSYSLPEAVVLVSALRSAGVPADIAEYFHVSVVWHHLVAVQGLRIVVPDARINDARELMAWQAPDYIATERPRPSFVEAALAGIALMFGVVWPVWMRRYRARD